jgi:hypothetical protein
LRLSSVLLLALAIWFRSSFAILAATQLAALIVFAALVFVDVRRTAPGVTAPPCAMGVGGRLAKFSSPAAILA